MLNWNYNMWLRLFKKKQNAELVLLQASCDSQKSEIDRLRQELSEARSSLRFLEKNIAWEFMQIQGMVDNTELKPVQKDVICHQLSSVLAICLRSKKIPDLRKIGGTNSSGEITINYYQDID